MPAEGHVSYGDDASEPTDASNALDISTDANDVDIVERTRWPAQRLQITLRTLEMFKKKARLKRHSLIRGTCFSVVMDRFGCILANSEGSAETYKLSSQVGELDTFISHNWSTPRIPKFLVLALHFNLQFSSCMTALIIIVISTLSSLHVLPSSFEVPGGHKRAPCLWNTVLANFALMFFLLFGHTIQRVVFGRTRPCFLDKTCIHQTDEVLKQQGIMSLSLFLTCSERMLVVFRDTYLRKIWTVFELASFISMHPEKEVVLIPASMPRFFLSIIWLDWLSMLSILLHWILSDQHYDWLQHVIVVCLEFGTCMFQRNVARERYSISTQVTNFDIRLAQCFCENDRPFVEGSVVALMKHIERVPASADDHLALDSFNELVATELPAALESCFGRVGMRYRQVLAMRFSRLGLGMDFLCFLLSKGADSRQVGIQLASTSMFFFCWHPLVFALTAWVSAQALWVHGHLEWAFMFAFAIVLGLVERDFLERRFSDLCKQAVQSDVALVGVLCSAVALLTLTRVVYRLPRRRAVEKHRITVEMALLDHTCATARCRLKTGDTGGTFCRPEEE